MRTLFTLALLTVFAVPALAQNERFQYPGMMWSTTGNISPAEPGNIIHQHRVDQGLLYYSAIELFGTHTLFKDSEGYDWNNRTINGIGLRVTETIGDRGMIRFSAVYNRESRWISNTTFQGMSYSVDTYFDWGR